MMILMAVVFPAPLGPRSTLMLPCSTLSVRSVRARWEPNLRDTPASSRTTRALASDRLVSTVVRSVESVVTPRSSAIS